MHCRHHFLLNFVVFCALHLTNFTYSPLLYEAFIINSATTEIHIQAIIGCIIVQ